MNINHSFKLSTQGRVASAVSMAMVLPFISGAAIAATVTPVGSTNVNKVGNVDVVNIANPNANGLSHNQYTDFNVSQSGLVLNNSMSSGQSQLAGQLGANNNLSDTANVILNEVVSKNPSLLLGQQEVFGMVADYVLANPNGITCDDCGFINTDRASLVVGTPTIAADRLAGFNVGDGQNNKLVVKGDIERAKRLDLLAPTIDVNGNITASNEINVISGRNTVDYDTLAVSQLTNQEEVTLDGSVLGSMNSGKIRIHNTDKDASQHLQGKFNAEEVFEANADNLIVNDSDIEAGSVSLLGGSTLYVGGDVKMDRDLTPETTKRVDNWVKQTQSADTQNQSFDGSTIRGGDVKLAGGNVDIEGSQIDARTITATGGDIDVSGMVTTNKTTSKVRNTKGAWYNETRTEERTQQFHDSSLNASDSILLSSNEDLTISGTTLTGGEVALTAGNNLTANSVITENSKSDTNRYKNETAKLKTGEKLVSQGTQAEHLTSISGTNVQMSSGGDQLLEGVQLASDSAALSSDQSLTISSSKTTNHKTNDENFLYWGGIGGGETNIDNEQQNNLTGSTITTNGELTLSSLGDTTLSGSTINATGDLNLNTGNDLNISHDFAVESDYFEDRHGSAFNITDEKYAKDHKKQTAQKSIITGNNVTLTGDNIAITGSDITAAGKLETDATNALTTDIANPTDITVTENFDISTVNTSKVTGNIFGCVQCADDVNLEDFSFEASSGLKGVTTITTTGTGEGIATTLTGADTSLTGDVVDLKGTQVSGTNNVDIDGTQVSTAVGDALTLVDSKLVRSTGPEIYVKGGLTGIEFGIGLGHDQIINEHHEYDAVDSTINSEKDINIVADDSLTNLGTKIKADNVNLSAQDIVQDAGYDRVVDRDVIAGGDAALKLFANVNPIVGASVGISGQGIGKVTENKTAIVTDIDALNELNITATNSAMDAGSNLNADTIDISANDYTSTAAYDSEVITTHSGSGEINVSATTSTFQDVTVGLNGKGEYQYQQTGDASAVQGNVTGNNVNINAATNANIANNFDTDSLNINAGQQAIVGQNDDKQWDTTGGGFFSASVGLNFSAASCGASPAFSGAGGFNFLDINNTQAKTTAINTGSLNLTGGMLAQVAGTNINADDSVIIKANKASILAAQDTNTALGANFTAKGGYSGSIDAGATLGVVNEKINKATSTTLNAADLSITANSEGDGVVIEGANITADNIDLTNTNANGNVDIHAATSKDKVGNFYLGANIGLSGGSGGKFSKGCSSCCSSCGGGGGGKMSYIPTSLGAQLIVDSDNSVYHTLGSIEGGNVNINSGNNIDLQGNIDADNLTLNAGSNLNINSAQDIVKKVDINQGISMGIGSLKLKPGISSEELLNTVNDGSKIDNVVNLNLAGKSNFLIDDQKVTQQATINADNLNTTVGSLNIMVNAANLNATNSNLNGATVATTDNNDYVHTIGASAEFDAMNILKLNQYSSVEDFKDVVNIDFTNDWNDEDGANTKANVKL